MVWGGWRWECRGLNGQRGSGTARTAFGGSQIVDGVSVTRVGREYIFCELAHSFPVALVSSPFNLIQEAVNSALKSFAGHYGGMVASFRSNCLRRVGDRLTTPKWVVDNAKPRSVGLSPHHVCGLTAHVDRVAIGTGSG